jgi:hypothetical protein
MSPDRFELTDPRVIAAVDEFEGMVAARYPDASFVVCEGEDPEGIYPRATPVLVPA